MNQENTLGKKGYAVAWELNQNCVCLFNILTKSTSFML
jgi:hypothetical protein